MYKTSNKRGTGKSFFLGNRVTGFGTENSRLERWFLKTVTGTRGRMEITDWTEFEHLMLKTRGRLDSRHEYRVFMFLCCTGLLVDL